MKTYLLNPRSIEGSVEGERTNERVTIEIAKLGCFNNRILKSFIHCIVIIGTRNGRK